MGENNFAELPTSAYGGVLLMAAIAYVLLQRTIVKARPPGSGLAAAFGKDAKGKVSPALYAPEFRWRS